MKIRVVCSKGTYIRALARDIGMALESGAHLTALRRTRVGDVGIDCCLPIDEALERISECPLEFPDDYRIPFSMHVQGYKYAEIAEHMGLPLGTVKSRIFFARRKLQERFADYRYDA